LLEAAGLPARPTQHCDGTSLLSLVSGAANTLERDCIFWHYPHYSNQGGRPGAAVVSGDWKLIWHFEDDRVELFDLKADVGESVDLSTGRQSKAQELKQSIIAWHHEMGALIPAANPEWPQWVAQLNASAAQQ
jgi:arylsulfatase A-like enzyme